MKRFPRRAFLTGIAMALAAVMIALAAYIADWYGERARIEADAARYRTMYESATPTVAAAPATPTASPAQEPTEAPTAEPTATAARARESLPRVEDEPIPTPDADTLVFALPTAPPVQERFAALLGANPDTVGFLTLGDALALPVVQRKNDNDFYLDHSFEGAEAPEGALFLDGSSLLVPEDDCLIVYGHNMKNGTMFGTLHRFAGPDYLKAHPIVRFDTLYDDRTYVPFAAFSASMERGGAGYFEVRRFLLEGDDFDAFTAALRGRSVFDAPVDVARGDGLLLLVTCDYSERDGRFILALRRLRADETEADAAGWMARATAK